MLRFSLQETFLLHSWSAKRWEPDPTARNYFEIYFIEEGKGKHYINEFIIYYQTGDIFLIAPQDEHRFEIEEETQFCVFQFTELLFSGKMNLPDRSYWMRRIEHIINHPNLMPGDIIKNEDDRELIWDIHDVIAKEYQEKKEYYHHNISNMVSTILSIIARNISDSYTRGALPKKDSHTVVDDILGYIRQYVHDPAKMKISALAKQFNMTSSKISSVFKKQMGEPLHHYILMYKMDLVKFRLKNTDFTVSEIAFQLGFTDESHLTRIFKKYENSTPKQYKEAKSIASP
ncbi:AraC family transcriptional regulator [Croceiramulus getboli]|nr:AraC family transcriptional regulator [Flavobacteriaceae bacterium YJPT1-3]